MNFDAFGLIQDALTKELATQAFKGPEPLETEDGRAVVYTTDDVAYGLFYNKHRFELKSTNLTEEGELEDWRGLSVWLFDEETGERADADSIVNDFVDIVKGPKTATLVQQKKKKSKNEERAVDPLFFLNRLVNIFPEIKDEMKEERIVYGQIRFATFAKENVAPKCQDLAENYPDSELTEKMCTIFSDLYKSGDLDLRSVISISVLNNISDKAFLAIQDKLGPELKLDTKYTRKLKGKNIKPEKERKEKKKIIDRLQ